MRDSNRLWSTHVDRLAASQNGVDRANWPLIRTALTDFDRTSIGGGDGDEERDDGGETHIGLRDVLRRRSVSEWPWPGEHKEKRQARNHTS